MSFKRKISMMISIVFIFNMFSLFPSAKVPQASASTKETVPVSEWYLPGTNTVYAEFYNAVNKYLPAKDIKNLTDDDFKSYINKLELKEGIEGIPPVISRFTNVKSVVIKNPNINRSNIPASLFDKEMPNLTNFSLIGTEDKKIDIPTLPNNFLQNAPKLESIEIKNTNLTELPVNFLKNSQNLSKVVITENKRLTKVNDDFLVNTKEVMESIDLRNNALESLPENFLHKTREVSGGNDSTGINLSNNNLTSIPSKIATGFNNTSLPAKLNILDVSNNYLLGYTPNVANIEKYYSHGNLFSPVRDDSNNLGYYTLSPKSEFYNKTITFGVNQKITTKDLSEVLGYNPLLNATSGERKNMSPKHELRFVPTEAHASMFDSNGMPIKPGAAQGYIEFSSRTQSNFDLRTDIVTININGPSDKSDSTLSYLNLDNATLYPAFSPDVISYTAMLQPDVTSTNVAAKATNANAKVEGDIGTIEVSYTSNNNIKINVTSEDNKSVTTYHIELKRSLASQNDTRLRDLSFEMIPFNDFNPNKSEYTLNVENSTKYTRINVSTYDSNARIVSDEVGKQVYLNHGLNVFTFKVISPNSMHSRLYKINIIRASGGVRQDNVSLTALSVDGKELMPNFYSDSTNYKLNVDRPTDKITVNATGVEGSTVKINDTTASKATIPLNIGSNTVKIQVIAKEGYSREYTIEVNRTPLSNDATLAGLFIHVGDSVKELTPEFNPNTKEYTVNADLSESDPNPTISAIPKSKAAKVYGTGYINNFTSTNGEKVSIPITVVAEDGITTNVYTVKMGRQGKKVSSDTSLKSLSITNIKGAEWLTPFAPNRDTFEIVVPSETASTNILAETSEITSVLDPSYLGTKQLNVGKNEFKLLVKPNNSSKAKEYTFIITRKSANRLASSDTGLLYLEIEGQKITPNFSPDKKDYNLYVDNSVTNVILKAIPSAPGASYSIVKLGDYSLGKLREGDNEFVIRVVAEDKSQENVAVLNIHRATTVKPDLHLTNMTVSSTNASGETVNYELYPAFDKNITSYNIEVPNDVNRVNINASAVDSSLVIKGTGVKVVKRGKNKFEVSVAHRASVNPLVYTINITRAPSSNASLSSLKLTDSRNNNIPISPEFNKDVFEYYAEVEHNVEKINIGASTEDPGATTTGDRLDNKLNSGLNVFKVKTTSEDGTNIKETIIRVNRKKSNEAALSSLELKTETNSIIKLSPTFSSETYSYEAKVSEDTTKVLIQATPQTGSKLDGKYIGARNLVTGKNTFEVKAFAEDGVTAKTYTINITKPISTDSRLRSINIKDIKTGDSININGFTPSVYEYNLNVTDISDIEIEAVASSKLSIVTGTGFFTLKGPITQNKITVTAENGAKSEYILNFIKSYSSNSLLESLGVEGVDISPSFDPRTFEYTAHVLANTTSVNINATPVSKLATVTGAGVVSVTKGNNVKKITVTAEDGSTSTYTLTIVVPPSYDATLSNLQINANGTAVSLSPTFAPDVTNYTATVGPNVDKITIVATKNDANATVSGHIGEQSLQTGTQTFKITVTSDGGSEKIYYITVTKASSSDSTLKGLTVTAGGAIQTLSPAFSPNIKKYTLNVPNNISSVSVAAIANHHEATVTGDVGTRQLNIGENNLNITVIAADKTVSIYTIVVNRAKSSNASLKSLRIFSNSTEQNLTPAFTPGNHNYELTVTNDITSIDIRAITQDANATISGNTGIQNLVVGDNNFTVTVTAQDGKTVQNYRIKVTRQASNDANLSAINVTSNGSNLPLSPEFNPNTTTYTISVDNNIDRININATKNHAGATVVGAGEKAVKVGVNEFVITVTAEDKTTVKTYKVTVIRAVSTDSSLKSLKALVAGSEQTLSPSFSPSHKEYALTVSNSVTSIELQAIANHANASIVGTGVKNLNVGNNDFAIEVTAEDKVTKSTYRLRVSRLASNDATLSDLKVSVNGNDQALTPNFESNKTSYTLNVANNVNSVNISATKSNPDATVSGHVGDVNLNIGENTFVVKVTAPDGVSFLEYKIIINRAPSANATLSKLEVSASAIVQTLNPTFVPTTTNYKLTVQHPTTKINIKAIAADNTATVTGQVGDQKLTVGVNTFTITVTAQDGITKTTYTIEVTRLQSSNADLLDLEVLLNGSPQALTPSFSPSIVNYTVNVPEGTTQIQVKPLTEDCKSVVSGDIGIRDIKAGTNTLTIKVTAQDGTIKNYTINVIRAVSSNSSLSSLELSSNDTIIPITPNFSPSVNAYTAEVANDVSSLTISAVKSFAGATVSGHVGTQSLNVGVNNFSIKVTAEDGTSTSTYTVAVTRLKSSDATLSSLQLKDISGNLINITPKFDPNTKSYAAKIIHANDTIQIEAVTSNPNATINKGDLGIKKLVVGDNTFSINVTAEDGQTTKTYSVSVQRSEQVKDIIISGLPSGNTIQMNEAQVTDIEFNFAPFNSFDNIKTTSSNPDVAVMEFFVKNDSAQETTRSSKKEENISLFGRVKTLVEGKTTITVASSDGNISKTFDIVVDNSVKPNVPVIDQNTGIIQDIPLSTVTQNQTQNISANNPTTSDTSNASTFLFLLVASLLVLIAIKKREKAEK